MHLVPTLLAAAGLALAQFPPTPSGVTILKSKFHENVTISYKEPGICETTPGVKSYSGYVHLPPGLLSDIAGEDQLYPINTFFWFFEARKDPANAPLSIWLNGGPGGSSAMGLLQENGPCFVGNDSNSTYLNPWSWNNEVNMLYLDQPTQVGYSYDVPTNGTFDPQDRTVTPKDFNYEAIPEQNFTAIAGTFSSQDGNSTANSTENAAHAIWHFAQIWFEEFPFYKPADEKISLWTESYGGRYGPGFFRFWQEQNEKIANGTIQGPGTHFIHLDTLGIINGCIDGDMQMISYIDIAYNNTYGIKAINESQYNAAVDSYWAEGGCKEGIMKCRELAKELDPEDRGNVEEVDRFCSEARQNCRGMTDPFEKYADTPRARYDIAHPAADPFPEPYLYGYLNQHWVQAALGVPVNHTASSRTVSAAFSSTGDFIRGDFISAIGYLLDSGVKVATMYGDRDFACNWIGGERSLLAVNYSDSTGFRKAGYVPILAGGVGGVVKQYGNFSFSRVFEAGHEVPSYQPEVAYKIFMRATFNLDVGTGLIPVFDEFSTLGPESSFHIKNKIPEWPESVCYVLNPGGTCLEEQWKQVLNGTVVVKDWLVVEYNVTKESLNLADIGEVNKQRVLMGEE